MDSESESTLIDDALLRLNADLQVDADCAPYRLLVRDPYFWLADARGSLLQAVAETARMPAWPTDMTSEEWLEIIADKLQDEVLQFLWGPTWPKCPNHRHPPRATVVNRVAV